MCVQKDVITMEIEKVIRTFPCNCLVDFLVIWTDYSFSRVKRWHIFISYW